MAREIHQKKDRDERVKMVVVVMSCEGRCGGGSRVRWRLGFVGDDIDEGER